MPTDHQVAVCKDALSIYYMLRERLAELEPDCEEAQSVKRQLRDARIGVLTRCVTVLAPEGEAPELDDIEAVEEYVRAVEQAIGHQSPVGSRQ